MPRPRLTIEEKQRRGTLRAAREQSRVTVIDPRKELEWARETLSEMRYNLTIANESLKKDGMHVELSRLDTHYKNIITVRKINPAFKIQREALRAIESLTKEIEILEEAARIADAKQSEADDMEEFAV